MAKLKSLTIDGQKFDIPGPTTKYLKITNPTWVFNGPGELFIFTLTEQQCLENDIIEIYNDQVGGGPYVSNYYYINVPNVNKPLKINFVGNVPNNALGFIGLINPYFPRGLQDGSGGYLWNGGNMLLDSPEFFAYTGEISPQFIQYDNSGYDIILRVLFTNEI